MSVFRKMTTKLNDEQCLVQGLQELGYKPEKGKDLDVRGHGSEKFKADVVLRKEDTGHKGDVGFQKQKDGSYSLIYDTWLFRLNNDEFIGKVAQAHGKAKIRRIAAQQGIDFEGMTTDKNGKTTMRYVLNR